MPDPEDWFRSGFLRSRDSGFLRAFIDGVRGVPVEQRLPELLTPFPLTPDTQIREFLEVMSNLLTRCVPLLITRGRVAMESVGTIVDDQQQAEDPDAKPKIAQIRVALELHASPAQNGGVAAAETRPAQAAEPSSAPAGQHARDFLLVVPGPPVRRWRRGTARPAPPARVTHQTAVAWVEAATAGDKGFADLGRYAIVNGDTGYDDALDQQWCWLVLRFPECLTRLKLRTGWMNPLLELLTRRGHFTTRSFATELVVEHNGRLIRLPAEERPRARRQGDRRGGAGRA
jgi:hypothetical protein